MLRLVREEGRGPEAPEELRPGPRNGFPKGPAASAAGPFPFPRGRGDGGRGRPGRTDRDQPAGLAPGSSASGSVKANIAPPEGALSIRILPPCASTARRQNASPRPVPLSAC